MAGKWLWIGALAGLSGCVNTAEMPQAQDGKRLFMDNCAVCHGENGKGGGALAEGLTPAPADLTTIALRKGGFPRAEVMSAIDGYARSDGGTEGMPEFGALLEGDLVPFDSGDGVQTPTPRKLVALLAYIESLQSQAE